MGLVSIKDKIIDTDMIVSVSNPTIDISAYLEGGFIITFIGGEKMIVKYINEDFFSVSQELRQRHKNFVSFVRGTSGKNSSSEMTETYRVLTKQVNSLGLEILEKAHTQLLEHWKPNESKQSIPLITL